MFLFSVPSHFAVQQYFHFMEVDAEALPTKAQENGGSGLSDLLKSVCFLASSGTYYRFMSQPATVRETEMQH